MDRAPATAARAALVQRLASTISDRAAGRVRPFRVAVDGRTAAGKTTIADELQGALERIGEGVLRLSIDGFHRPKAERYRRSRLSPIGYLDDARDWPAVRDLMLRPLGPGGDNLYTSRIFDVALDAPVVEPRKRAPARVIAIVDGSFLQRQELQGCFDYVVFVRVSASTSRRRGVERDAALLGGVENAEDVYDKRYIPAFALYEDRLSVEAGADVIIDNDSVDRPAAVFPFDPTMAGPGLP